MIADLYGAAYYGRISSVMSVFLSLTGTAAPVGAGLLYDHFGSYQLVVWLALIFALIAVGIVLLSKPEAQQRSEINVQPEVDEVVASA